MNSGKKNCLHFEKRLPEFKIYSTSSVWHVSYIFVYKYSQWSRQQILISASLIAIITDHLFIHTYKTLIAIILQEIWKGMNNRYFIWVKYRTKKFWKIKWINLEVFNASIAITILHWNPIWKLMWDWNMKKCLKILK